MKAESAAGRKTDRFERAARRYEEKLETQLALLTDAMRGPVERADAVEDDKYSRAHQAHHRAIAALIRESRHLVIRANWFRRAWTHWQKVEAARTTSQKCICNPLALFIFFDPLCESRLRFSRGGRGALARGSGWV